MVLLTETWETLGRSLRPIADMERFLSLSSFLISSGDMGILKSSVGCTVGRTVPPYLSSIYQTGMSVKGHLLASTKEAFGKRVRRAREGVGLTQAALGALVGGRSQKAVSEWEAGLKEPDIELLGKLAVVLTTTVGWLVAGEGKAPVYKGRKARETSDEMVKRVGDAKARKGA